MRYGRSVLAGCVGLTALMASAAQAQSGAPAADAADAPDGGDMGSEVIVVTAQKRSESLLTVPLAVTAVASESLIRQNLVQLSDYATRIPGLSASGDRLSAIAIRGLNAVGGTSPTVAVTIDDVPFGPSSWAGVGNFPDLDPADIQQIEVLRGPQGTLYGAASLGGLIKYVTRTPDTNEWSGRAEATVSDVAGGGTGYGLRGAVNVPVIEDAIGVRISGYHRRDPSLLDRYSRTGALIAKDAGRNTVEGFRGAIYLRPFDALKINVSHLQQDRDYRNIGNAPVTLVDPYPTTFRPIYGYFGNDNTPSIGKLTSRLTQVRGDLDLGFATLTSVSGWGRLRNYSNSDVTRNLAFVYAGIPGFAPAVFPGAPSGSVVRIDNTTLTDKFSQEVRLASSGDGPIEWLIGGFYTNERSSVDQEIYGENPSGTKLGSIYINTTPSTFKEYAAFADVTYKFTDRFDVQAGLRYSHNSQSYQTQNTVNPAAIAFFGPSTLPAPRTSKDDSVTWLVSPRLRLNADLMVYARLASGYRPGGPNSSAAAPQPTFKPDRVVNYELGLKGQLLDRKLTIDTALFNIDWRDIQLQASTIAGLPYFTNGGKARSRGLEAAVTFAPGSGWEFNGNFTANDADLRQNLPVPTTGTYLLGAKNDYLPFAARFTSNLGFDKVWKVGGDVRLSIGANWNHVGRRNAGFRSSAAPVARRPAFDLPAYDVVDLRAGLAYGSWNLNLFLRNLTNERGVIAATDNAGVSASMTAVFIQPRTVGASASFSF